MLIEKKTWCPWCEGDFKRKESEKGTLYWVDECTKCKGRKLTNTQTGTVWYERA